MSGAVTKTVGPSAANTAPGTLNINTKMIITIFFIYTDGGTSGNTSTGAKGSSVVFPVKRMNVRVQADWM